jgi:hypothetical protein
MKLVVCAAWIGCSLMWNAALAQPALTSKAQLVRQITDSGTRGFTYQKRTQVTAEDNANTTWEEHRFEVKGGRIFLQGKDTSTTPFAGELGYATDLGSDDPAIADLFTRVQHGDTAIATLVPNIRRKCDLTRQAIVRDKSGFIRYAAVRTLRSSTLYQTDTDTEIWFDAEGRYLRHTLELHLRVRLLGQPRRVRVVGQRS